MTMLEHLLINIFFVEGKVVRM